MKCYTKIFLHIQDDLHKIILIISYSFQSFLINVRFKKKVISWQFYRDVNANFNRGSESYAVPLNLLRSPADFVRCWNSFIVSPVRAVSTEITHCIRRLRKIILLLPCIQLLLYRDGVVYSNLWYTPFSRGWNIGASI